MINIHVILRFSLFTNEVKEILDEALKDLPMGARVYVEIQDYFSPFTPKEKEQQVVSCYSPVELDIITFGIPKGIEVSSRVGNSEESAENSRNEIEVSIGGDLAPQGMDPRVATWLYYWESKNAQILFFFL